MRNKTKIYLMISLIMLVLSQIFAKMGSLPIVNSNFSIIQIVNIYTLLTLLCLFIQGLSWITVLKDANLSYVYPFMSFSFVIVVLISHFTFGEIISPANITGSLLIVGGIGLHSLGG